MKLLFILLLGLGLADELSTNIDSFLINDYRYVKSTAYSFEEALLQGLSNLADLIKGEADSEMSRTITKATIDTTSNQIIEDVFMLNQQIVSSLDLGNITIQSLTRRNIKEHINEIEDNYQRSSSLNISINGDGLISIEKVVEESGLGESSNYKESYIKTYLNCTIKDLLDEFRNMGIIMKTDNADFEYNLELYVPRKLISSND